jgi:hypothetical protein
MRDLLTCICREILTYPYNPIVNALASILHLLEHLIIKTAAYSNRQRPCAIVPRANIILSVFRSFRWRGQQQRKISGALFDR